MKHKTLLFLLLAALSLPVSAANLAAPSRMTCEKQCDPQVIDSRQPRLSWINNAAANANGAAQSAWQVRVATDAAKLASPDCWNSGKRKGGQSINIRYEGKALTSGRTYWWQVRTWDENGKASPWSEPAQWTMGMLDAHDWKGYWIGAPWQTEAALPPNPSVAPPAAPLLRKEFTIGKTIKSARFFGTGLGYFELYVNGKKVGDDVLVPAQTNCSKRPGLLQRGLNVDDNFMEYRVMYLGYDLTQLLNKGENVIGAMLGNGFFNCNDHKVMGYGSPRFIGQVIITFTDGSQETIPTDTSWKIATGPIVYDQIYTGEYYDARKEIHGWSAPAFNASAWKNAIERSAPTGKLVAQDCPTDKVMEVLQPKSIKRLDNGNYQIDFGEEIAGWIHFKGLNTAAGDTLVINYLSEMPNGKNIYIANGAGNEAYHTHFSWFAFRTAEIVGWKGNLTAENVTAEAVYNNAPRNGYFACSNDLFNAIDKIWNRSQTDNMHGGIASDCPHRERLAYTGDAQVACVTVMHNYDAASFYNKWIADIRGAQNVETGYVPNGAPWEPTCGGGAPWGAAMNIMPWEYYLHYGDTAILADNYEAMKAQVRFMFTWTDKNGVMNMDLGNYWKSLGDWCAPNRALPPTDLVHTFYLWRCADYTARAAKVLGKKQEAQYYTALAQKTANAFHSRFYNAGVGSYGDRGANIFALVMGVPAQRKDAVLAAVKRDYTANGFHLDTGIFGTQFLFETLNDNGLADIACKIMNQRDFPSYGYWIEQGATTTWEQWSGTDSRNHPMFGGGLIWFYRNLAGLKADPEMPGFKHFIFEPTAPDGLDWARYSTQSPYGPIAVNWEKQGGTFTAGITVPVGATATVLLPCGSGQTPVGDTDKNCSYLGTLNGRAAFNVNSGSYTFSITAE